MIIGISGKMGSGKDTVAKYLYVKFQMLKRLENGGVIVCRFAERLKRVTSILTQTSYDDQLSRQGKQKVPPGFTESLGTLQQKVGMALREHIHPDVWIHDFKMKPVFSRNAMQF